MDVEPIDDESDMDDYVPVPATGEPGGEILIAPSCFLLPLSFISVIEEKKLVPACHLRLGRGP